ncbi:hypothetical protein TNCV_4573181 [Trichonephila clavipes]|nr:hypothetical protein TNCV_4573181 [Trichonephila clavipes]
MNSFLVYVLVRHHQFSRAKDETTREMIQTSTSIIFLLSGLVVHPTGFPLWNAVETGCRLEKERFRVRAIGSEPRNFEPQWIAKDNTLTNTPMSNHPHQTNVRFLCHHRFPMI